MDETQYVQTFVEIWSLMPKSDRDIFGISFLWWGYGAGCLNLAEIYLEYPDMGSDA